MVRPLSLSQACEGFIHYKKATGWCTLPNNSLKLTRRAGPQVRLASPAIKP